MLKAVHYLNQFFGGIGGEDRADAAPSVVEGSLGPGMGFQKALGDNGKIVGTVICGDNYFADNIEKAADEVIKLVSAFKPDIVIAGPAFNAGRYGIACGAVCQTVNSKLGVPAVTGMYKDNPGMDLYRKDVYIIETAESVRGMPSALSQITALAVKLASNSKIGSPEEEGYFPRGRLINEESRLTGAERAVSMLLEKLEGKPFESEVSRPSYDRVDPVPGIKVIQKATIALVTDGGLVPNGNPDRIEIRTATRFGRYPLSGIASLDPEDYEVNHEGYDSVFVRQDPNRLVPVDVMRDLEKEGQIGSLHDAFFSTTGVANIVDNVIKMGKAIGQKLVSDGVDGVILTST